MIDSAKPVATCKSILFLGNYYITDRDRALRSANIIPPLTAAFGSGAHGRATSLCVLGVSLLAQADILRRPGGVEWRIMLAFAWKPAQGPPPLSAAVHQDAEPLLDTPTPPGNIL